MGGDRYWMLDKLDTGCWMLDTGYWILDAGCWISWISYIGSLHNKQQTTNQRSDLNP